MIRIVVLAYNEAAGIGSLLIELDEALRRRGWPYQFVIVNDGSTDGTVEAVRALLRRLPITLLNHERNLGVGRAFDTGLRHAAGEAAPSDTIVTIEGDRTNQPETLLAMLSEMERGCDVVCASRYLAGGRYVGFPWMRHAFSLAANWTMRLFFPIPGVRDYTIFYRAYRAGVLAETIRAFGDRFIESRGFTANAEILFKTAMLGPLRCSEVAMVYRYDLKKGGSKMRVWRNIREYGALFGRILRRRISRGSAPIQSRRNEVP